MVRRHDDGAVQHRQPLSRAERAIGVVRPHRCPNRAGDRREDIRRRDRIPRRRCSRGAASMADRVWPAPSPVIAEPRATLANWQDPPYNRWAFQHVRELIPTAKIARSAHLMRRLPRAELELGTVSFFSGDRELTVQQFLAETYTDGFVVLHDGRVAYEQYFNDMTADTPHLLMSVSKSVTSTVAGILAGRGVLDGGAEVTEVV